MYVGIFLARTSDILCHLRHRDLRDINFFSFRTASSQLKIFLSYKKVAALTLQSIFMTESEWKAGYAQKRAFQCSYYEFSQNCSPIVHLCFVWSFFLILEGERDVDLEMFNCFLDRFFIQFLCTRSFLELLGTGMAMIMESNTKREQFENLRWLWAPCTEFF